MKEELSLMPPVIALTAYSSDKERKMYLSIGFSDFIGKPIIPESLTSILTKWTLKANSIIDFEVVDNLQQYGGADMIQEAMRDFSEDTEKQIEECFVSLSEQNHKKILDHLHAIKGNASTLGINRVAKSARQTEDLLKKGYSSRIGEELNNLLYFFNEFKTLYFT